MTDLYRSKGYAKGATRKLGNLHFHVDCAGDTDDRLLHAARECEKAGWPAKLSRISVARPGNHVTHPDYVEDYRHHTPELSAGHNTFSEYLTALLGTVGDALEVQDAVRSVRIFFDEHRAEFASTDSVVEIERVSAILHRDGIEMATPAFMPNYRQHAAARYEVHHFADLPIGRNVTFDRWTQSCERVGVDVGGWFQFSRDDRQSFRSVRFAHSIDALAEIEETRKVQRVAEMFAEEANVRTVVEQIIDIWRISRREPGL